VNSNSKCEAFSTSLSENAIQLTKDELPSIELFLDDEGLEKEMLGVNYTNFLSISY
jgi:hypothetical protein